ncbi:hypothetical protein [Pedobacter sp. MW01-1-1]|uniref:hypothetical protein n=1 Tax=Pedobacter sp. MW01-1-1 TaxID=3383027 RepID=UPI003FEEC2AD
MKTTLHNIYAIAFNSLIGVLVAMLFHFSPIVGAVATNLFMLVLAVVKQFYTGKPIFFKGFAFAGLLKEIWIGKLMEKFYPDGSWLLESEDMSMWVENNTINLADMGADPEVLVNNTTYPIEMVERADGALALPLDYFDTKNTVVRNATAIQLAYNKLESVIRQHRNALFTKNLQKAAHAYGPSADGAYKPVIQIGASIIDAFIDAEAKFDELLVPIEDRIVLLNPKHKAMLKKEDKDIYKDIFGSKGSGTLYSFKVYLGTVNPVYDGATKAKKAFGAASAGGDLQSTLFYSKKEVMRAEGTYDMFSRLKDPEARGDIVGFQKRFLAMPIRDKYIGAIIGNATA